MAEGPNLPSQATPPTAPSPKPTPLPKPTKPTKIEAPTALNQPAFTTLGPEKCETRFLVNRGSITMQVAESNNPHGIRRDGVGDGGVKPVLPKCAGVGADGRNT